jgi:hypothetical protein
VHDRSRVNLGHCNKGRNRAKQRQSCQITYAIIDALYYYQHAAHRKQSPKAPPSLTRRKTISTKAESGCWQNPSRHADPQISCCTCADADSPTLLPAGLRLLHTYQAASLPRTRANPRKNKEMLHHSPGTQCVGSGVRWIRIPSTMTQKN